MNTSQNLMWAAVLHEHGPPENLVVEQIPLPEPGEGEVRVRIAAAAANFPDVLIMDNRYQVRVPVPFSPGSEFAGTISAVGPGVDRWSVGDDVFGAVMVGAFAGEVVVSAAGLKAVPAGVEPITTAGFWVAYATAYHSLRSVAKVQPGERVLVLGAAGGVGMAAVDVARVLGATVVAAASTEAKRAVCLERGAEIAVDYTADDFREQLRAAAPKGFDVVIDPVGGQYSEPAVRSMGFGGRFVTIGYAAGEIPRIPLNLVLLKGITIMGFEMRSFGERGRDQARRDETELMELLATGRLDPYVSARFSLADAGAALRLVADRGAVGKVLVVPEHG